MNDRSYTSEWALWVSSMSPELQELLYDTLKSVYEDEPAVHASLIKQINGIARGDA